MYENLPDKDLCAMANTPLEKALVERLDMRARDMDELIRNIRQAVEAMNILLEGKCAE